MSPTRSTLRQAPWGVLSQGLNAGTNFLLSFLVARSQPAAEFGRFALVLVLVVLAIGLVRETGNTVLTIAYARDRDALFRAGRRSTAYATGLGVLGGLCCLAVALVVAGPIRPVLLVVGIAFPFLLLQDAVRGLLIAAGEPRAAAANDGLWAGVQIASTAVVLVTVAEPAMWVFAATWAAGGICAAGYGLVRVGLLPEPASPHRWVSVHRRLAIPLLTTFALTTLPVQVVFLVMPLVSDFAQTGVLRAAYLLFGPIATLFASVYTLALVDAVRQGTPSAVTAIARRVSVVLAGIGVAWGAIVLVIPGSIGNLLMGETWDATTGSRVLLGVGLVAEGVIYGATTMMGALRQPERMVRAQLVATPIMLLLAFGLAVPYGAAGAAAGIAVGHTLCAVVAWAQAPAACRSAAGVRDTLTPAPKPVPEESS